MRPEEALYTKWSDAKDSVLIGGSGNCKVSLLGSNLESSVLPCAHGRMDGFTLAIPKGKRGVVAVRASRFNAGRKGDQVVETNFFVSVDNSGEKPNVDLTEVWVPSASRMGHIHNFGYIEVQIGEERFTTDKAEFTNGKHKEPNTYTVDGNTLVRYLVDEATENEVRAAAKDHVAEISARERLYEVGLENNRLNAELKSAKEDISDLEKGIAALQKEAAANSDLYRAECGVTEALKTFLRALRGSLMTRSFGLARTRPLVELINRVPGIKD